MVPNMRVAIVIGFVTLSLLPFTNCGQYADPANSATAASADFVPCNANCVIPTLENLKIGVNMGNATTYTVPAGLTEFNLGGDCNEGGYPYNFIRWELQLNGLTVRTSAMTGMAPSGPVDTVCVNGRFMLYVNLGAIPQDNVDRSGLKVNASGTRAAYDLYIEIYGKDSVNDPAPKRNMVKGRTRVSLSTS
jgi:hypothetical protein